MCWNTGKGFEKCTQCSRSLKRTIRNAILGLVAFVLFKYAGKSYYVFCLLPQPASGAAVVAGGAVEAGPVEGSVPLLGATAAICRNCI